MFCLVLTITKEVPTAITTQYPAKPSKTHQYIHEILEQIEPYHSWINFIFDWEVQYRRRLMHVKFLVLLDDDLITIE